MKKIIFAGMAAILALAFSGCSNDDDSSSSGGAEANNMVIDYELPENVGENPFSAFFGKELSDDPDSKTFFEITADTLTVTAVSKRGDKETPFITKYDYSYNTKTESIYATIKHISDNGIEASSAEEYYEKALKHWTDPTGMGKYLVASLFNSNWSYTYKVTEDSIKFTDLFENFTKSSNVGFYFSENDISFEIGGMMINLEFSNSDYKSYITKNDENTIEGIIFKEDEKKLGDFTATYSVSMDSNSKKYTCEIEFTNLPSELESLKNNKFSLKSYENEWTLKPVDNY